MLILPLYISWVHCTSVFPSYVSSFHCTHPSFIHLALPLYVYPSIVLIHCLYNSSFHCMAVILPLNLTFSFLSSDHYLTIFLMFIALSLVCPNNKKIFLYQPTDRCCHTQISTCSSQDSSMSKELPPPPLYSKELVPLRLLGGSTSDSSSSAYLM